MNTINRLQLRHHTPIFETREDAIEYIYSQIRFADEGLAFEDKSYGFSLLGEPTVLRYKNVTEADPTGENDPHLIFAIGSATNEGTQYNDNRFCIIDIDKTEKEIEDLWEELEKAIKSLSIFTKDTNTLKLYSEKTEDGTVISGDVVVATSHIFDDARKPNIILSTDDGLFTYVNMEYDKDNDLLTFTVNGETKEWFINNNYLVGGWYCKKDESLHLKSKDDSEIVISLEKLIDEWGVEGNSSNTPIVLTREKVKYGDDALHNHVEPWQDVLKADVRLADRRYNILKKTSDGRYLYVDGLANNITFFKNGEEMSVQEALANATKGVSNDSTNIIYEKADGYYATAALKYFNKENKLVFTTSNVTGGTTTEEIKLNSVEAFKKIVYDPVTETLIIMYVDGNGDIQECDVPIGEMMQDWEWDIVNDGHNVKLHKQRVIGGNDKVSADAAIYDDPDNILVDKNHELFVKGTADNIRYGRDGNVSDELDKLNANDADINTRLNETSGKVDTLRAEFDAEVERATGEEQRIESKLDTEITRSKEKDTEHDNKISTIEQTIGDGFSIDGHETVTYKFNELSAKTNTISAKTDTIDANLSLLSARTEAEIVRAKGEEQRIEKKFDDALGDGFDIRNTVRDEFDKEKTERVGEDARLQAEIDALSANTEGRLMDVINIDHSINVDKTDPVRPVVSVNLSDEQIENMPNVIKLNNDGLYAGVDLDYYFETGTSKNVLVFKTTNGTKTFDLKTNSVVDKIYYDPTREAIIIEYTVDGHRMPDVVVPVHDLINEWRVSEDTNGAIKLYKFRESGATQDVLYAESLISSHEDNILINDNGALYVSGAQIEQNKADIAALGERMDTAEADIDALEDGLAAEIARATGEEQRIEEKLDREIERSTTEDDNLWETLRAEIARSTDKDNEHDAKIAEEIQRAKNAEHALHDEIVEEATARISGDTALSTKIDNEITRATSEEQRIEAKLNDEITRSTAKDNEHDSKIVELRTDLEAEITRSTNKDNEHDAKIVEEINARVSGDTALNTKIENETTRAITEEQRIEAKLDTEVTRSKAKDNEHDVNIQQLRVDLEEEIDRASQAEDTLHNEIVAESNRAISAETALDNRITNVDDKLEREITRSTAKDSEHDASINGLRTDLSNEITDRTNADNELRDLIHQEEDRAKTAESAITHSLDVEIIDRQNADNTLDQKIDTEITRAKSEERRIETELGTKIDNEISRATGEEQRIEAKLDNEITRSTNKDDDLQSQISNEITRAISAESSIREALTTEIAQRQVADANLQTQITAEVERAQGAENALGIQISAETVAREAEDAHIWAKIRPIEFYDTTTVHNERVRNTGENPDEIRHSVILSQAENNIIKASDTLGGIYATAKLSYNQSANALTLYGANDQILNTVILGPGSLIKDVSYDQTEKDLVITYRRAGESEDTIMKFPVADLFNEWDIQNPSEGSALELHKVNQTGETGTVDILWGRVLLTGAVERPDGTIDYGDNIIRIVNNGLYASGSAMTEAINIAECTRNELKEVEMSVLGHKVDQECGSGYTYSPNVDACFINSATSMYDADAILDKYVCSAHTRIDDVEKDVDCLWQEVNITQENVLGFTIPPCGINADGTPYHYTGHIDACIISAATSMDDADVLLDEAFCGIIGGFGCISAETKMVENVLGVVGDCDRVINYPASQGCLLSNATSFAQADLILEDAVCALMKMGMNGSERPSASVKVMQDPLYPDDPDKKFIAVDVRLSHGNDMGKWQSDEDLTITDYDGDCVESGDSGCEYSEFTDTNVLRIVDFTSMGFDPESEYNGLYLSNVWDCGQYTENGEGTPYEKYSIDDSATAANYYDRKYRNGKRYHNG